MGADAGEEDGGRRQYVFHFGWRSLRVCITLTWLRHLECSRQNVEVQRGMVTILCYTVVEAKSVEIANARRTNDIINIPVSLSLACCMRCFAPGDR